MGGGIDHALLITHIASDSQRLLRQESCDVRWMDTPAKRLKWARETKGRYASATEAAEARGWNASTYRTHENGQRNFPVEAAKRYASAFGVPWLWLIDGGPAPEEDSLTQATPILTKGEVAAGRWLDVDASLDPDEFEQFPIAANPNFPYESQYGLIVRGSSINKAASPGDILHCLDLGLTAVEPKENDLVIVERRRAQQSQREVTAKRITRRGKLIILSPDSTNPKWQPIKLDTSNKGEEDEVGVIALVIGLYRSLRKT